MPDEQGTAQIGVTGLAVMGSNLARNFAHNGLRVAVHNRTRARTDTLVERHGQEGDFVASESMADFVGSLERPRRIIIMVKAGAGTDAVIDELTGLLDEGDIILDGGNAHFEDTRRREKALRDKGLHFMGTGISGGEEGALNGPSIMPGGSDEAWQAVGDMLTTISAHVDGDPCCVHVGPDGAGHFVKMVHNGIEYADMQLIAEAYDLLRRAGGFTPARIADIFRTWNDTELESYLIEIASLVLAHEDAGTGSPFVDVVLDQAEQKGTGRWTVQQALDAGVPVSGIAEAVFARALSGHPEQRDPAREALPGPDADDPAAVVDDPEGFVDDVRHALYAAKIVAYAQGFDQIRAASDTYGWSVDLGSLARIWRGGCIIRAGFLDTITAAYDADPALPSLLVDASFHDTLVESQVGWRHVVSTAARLGVPAPGLSTALAYYDGLRSQRLPASLIQGLRDYFGAHTYQRVDREGVFHTMWGEDGREIDA